ncbi:MAG: hypothetical protein M1835_003829 [Candelina submexicana]|nr:MAG: hypothetical protein M1835_003829 [Candelina submexicana]
MQHTPSYPTHQGLRDESAQPHHDQFQGILEASDGGLSREILQKIIDLKNQITVDKIPLHAFCKIAQRIVQHSPGISPGVLSDRLDEVLEDVARHLKKVRKMIILRGSAGTNEISNNYQSVILDSAMAKDTSTSVPLLLMGLCNESFDWDSYITAQLEPSSKSSSSAPGQMISSQRTKSQIKIVNMQPQQSPTVRETSDRISDVTARDPSSSSKKRKYREDETYLDAQSCKKYKGHGGSTRELTSAEDGVKDSSSSEPISSRTRAKNRARPGSKKGKVAPRS